MNKKDILEYKRKYSQFRHHAWAGLGILSVVLAIRLIFLKSTEILTPIIVILVIYILISIIFTYRYSSGLSAEDKTVVIEQDADIEKERINAEVEKERLKLEKKKSKADAKKEKKSKK